MLRKLLDTIRRLSSARETGSYTGAFSYAAEWHAATHGFYKGFVAVRPRKDPPTEPDSNKELHYYRGGYVLGYLSKVLILVSLGYQVI